MKLNTYIIAQWQLLDTCLDPRQIDEPFSASAIRSLTCWYYELTYNFNRVFVRNNSY